MLEFMTTRSLNDIGGDLYLMMNKRLSIFMTMIAVINHRGINLDFECNFEEGLLPHNHKPCDHDEYNGCAECDHDEEDECDDGCAEVVHKDIEYIIIGLRINGSKIECIDCS